MAGVSVSTVSLVLNHHPRVSEKTRRRVQECAEALRYRPTGAARDLRSRRPSTVAVFLHDLWGPFYSELIRGVQDVADKHGYTTIASRAGHGQHGGVTRLLVESRVDAAVILDGTIPDAVIQSSAAPQLPLVVLDRLMPPTNYVVQMSADHEGGGYQATRHLIDEGYRRIAFVQGPADSWHGELRYQGYCRAMEEAGLANEGGVPERGDFTEDGGEAACLRILARRDRPEAIFAANDEMALGILHMLRLQGFRVPKDMALVGFDDIRLTQYVTPPLTTVRQPMYELGVLAMDQILTVWSGEEIASDPIWLPTELVVRASSSMVPCSDRQEAQP